jgi:hypothetical protein
MTHATFAMKIIASGIINARTDATTSMVQVSSPGILPFRVIAVAPNPFNLP